MSLVDAIEFDLVSDTARKIANDVNFLLFYSIFIFFSYFLKNHFFFQRN